MNRTLQSDIPLPAQLRSEVRRPIVVHVNDIDEEAAGKFGDDVSEAHETGQAIIPVVIDSYGGDVYALLGMIAIMDASQLPIATIVESKAMSCGAYLFALGAPGHRYIAPTATLIFHDLSLEAFDSKKTAEVKVEADELARLQAIISQRIAKHCGKPADFLESLLDANKHADVIMTAQEAKRHGVATHIGVPSFTTRISITHTFGIDGSTNPAVPYARRTTTTGPSHPGKRAKKRASH